MLEDSDGKRFMFEVYSENDGPVNGCKTDSKGTVVQGKHKTYRFVLLLKKKFNAVYYWEFVYILEWLPIHMKTGHIGSALFRIVYK